MDINANIESLIFLSFKLLLWNNHFNKLTNVYPIICYKRSARLLQFQGKRKSGSI